MPAPIPLGTARAHRSNLTQNLSYAHSVTDDDEPSLPGSPHNMVDSDDVGDDSFDTSHRAIKALPQRRNKRARLNDGSSHASGGGGGGGSGGGGGGGNSLAASRSGGGTDGGSTEESLGSGGFSPATPPQNARDDLESPRTKAVIANLTSNIANLSLRRTVDSPQHHHRSLESDSEADEADQDFSRYSFLNPPAMSVSVPSLSDGRDDDYYVGEGRRDRQGGNNKKKRKVPSTAIPMGSNHAFSSAVIVPSGVGAEDVDGEEVVGYGAVSGEDMYEDPDGEDDDLMEEGVAHSGGSIGLRPDFGSAMTLAKALSSHHVKMRKRPITSPRHYGRQLQRLASKSATDDRPVTPPSDSAAYEAARSLPVGPMTPAPTPDRKPSKAKRGNGVASAIKMPTLPNLYDPTIPMSMVPPRPPRPDVPSLILSNGQAYVLTPPSSSDEGEGRYSELHFEGPFTFDFENPVLTQRLGDLHKAILEEKLEREVRVREAMRIAVEQQKELRQARRAAAEAKLAEAEGPGLPPAGKAKPGLGGGVKAPAGGVGKGGAPPAVPPPPPVGGKKKKGKKKRSAHANANNVHHRDNYVPSRYPATSGYHTASNPDNFSPLELLARELDAPTSPAYSKTHTFIDPNTTFPGTDPTIPTHAQLGPSALAGYLADPDEWMCAFCEYELWFGEEPLFMRTLKNRKAVLKRRKKARDRAARAAAGVAGKKGTGTAATGTGTTTGAAGTSAPAPAAAAGTGAVPTHAPPPTRTSSPQVPENGKVAAGHK